MKKMKLLLLFILFTLIAKAPIWCSLVVIAPVPIQPYEDIWKAVCKVETNHDQFAVGDLHLKDKSYGIAQIRQIRLDSYNRQTGSTLKIADVYDPLISKKVFMYYADKIGPYEKDKIIRSWNGSGKQTYVYLKKVNKVLASVNS